jgi:pimeloyl-ACP methyl ester carboxylesterase
MPAVDSPSLHTERPPTDEAAETLVHIPTADGARLAVKRRPVAGGVPVVLAHGLGANANQWDLPEVRTAAFQYCSFASQLQEHGFDVWMLNFRGCGWPSMLSEPPAQQRDWNVDHYITCDLPAVIDHVARVTGERPLAIGQSMGAVTLGAYLIGAVREQDASGAERIVLSERAAVARQEALRGAVFIEMPAVLKWPASCYRDGRLDWRRLLGTWRRDSQSNVAFEMLSRALWLEKPLTAAGRIPLERLRPKPGRRDWWQRLPAPWQQRGRDLHMGALQRLLDLSSAVTGAYHHRAEVLHHGRRLMMDGTQAGVLRQFAKCIRSAAFVSDTGAPDVVYSDHYERIVLPALCTAGGRDRIANAGVTNELFFQRIRSADKEFVLFEELAHGEFGVAPVTCELAYPPILAWLHKHAQ